MDTQDHNDEDKRYVKAFYDPQTKLAVASTDVKDRHNERIDQTGWDLKNFKNNNVMLWAHNHEEIAVGNALNTKVSKASGKPQLVFTPDFHEHTPTAKALKILYEEGRLKTFSVGFLPKDMDGDTYTKQELLEISAVNVPANPEAMMMAYKSLKKAEVPEEAMKDVGINVELVDKLVSLEKDITSLTEKVTTLEKAQTPAAPPRSQVIRTRQSLVKVAARATDQLLAGEKNGTSKNERVKNIKVIKRAVEILSQSHKEQLHG